MQGVTISPNSELLAKELARWRSEAGMTQAELAAAIGIHVTHVQKMESTARTRRKPSMDTLTHIVDILDTERYRKGYTATMDRIDLNYAYRLAGYPEVAMPVEWSMMVDEADKQKSASHIERLANRIIDAARNRNKVKSGGGNQ